MTQIRERDGETRLPAPRPGLATVIGALLASAAAALAIVEAID